MSVKSIKLTKGMSRNEVNKLTFNWIKLADDVYMGSNYKHNWQCKCGNIIESRKWEKIKDRNSILCIECIYKNRKNKHKNKVEAMGGFVYIDSCFSGDILPDGTSVKKGSYIKVKHNYCGNIYFIKNINLSKDKRCPKCCGSYENSFAYHIERELGLKLEDVWDFEKNIINPYHIHKNSKDKVWIKCLNKEYHKSYIKECHLFVRSSKTTTKGCPYCHSKKIHPKDSFAQYHIDNTDPNFLDKYWDWEKNITSPWEIAPSGKQKVWIKCQNEKEHESYEIQVDSFKKGHRCGKCHNFGCCTKDSFGYHHFDKVLSWHPDNEISPFRVRRSSNSLIKFICHECGNIFSKSLNKIDNGQWCPRCSKSKGEKRIIDLLNLNSIKFIYDKPYFKDLLSDKGNPLRPDFILPDYKIWIEYDGEFHYRDIYMDDSFETLQAYDKRKDEYAKKNGWKLIRIPYWEFDNIENILEKSIIKFK